MIAGVPVTLDEGRGQGRDHVVVAARERLLPIAEILPGEYGDLLAWGIMDPVKVVRCALQNAANIGAMVLTTDAVVVDVPDEEEGGEDEAAAGEG